MKTAETIEQAKADPNASAENTRTNKRKNRRGDGARIKAWQWKPGQSGNPGGRPKNDVAKAICQAVFENNADEIYKGIAAELIAGKAYTLQVAAERAYGKPPQPIVGDESGEPITIAIRYVD